MSSALPPDGTGGIVLNSKTIPTIVGAFAIITSVYLFFEKVNEYQNRLTIVEHSDSIRNTEIKTLTSELKDLNSRLTDLTIELREFRALQK